MDLFHGCLPNNTLSSRRVHHDDFVKELHQRVWKKSKRGRSSEAFPKVVNEIVNESQILCFDEFQLPDVGTKKFVEFHLSIF